MEQKNMIDWIKIKKYIGITILILIGIILILSIGATMALRVATEAEIQDEMTFVRLTASLSRATDSDSKVKVEALAQELDKYAGIGKTTVTQKSSTTLVVRFNETGNEYEIDTDRGFESLPVTYWINEGTNNVELIPVGESVLSPKTFPTPTKEGWTFLGWKEDTIADANVLTQKKLGGSPMTLYAVYKQDVSLTYDGNGATSGSVETQNETRYHNALGDTLTPTVILSENGFTKTDMTFMGWNLGAVGESVTLDQSKTAIAQWQHFHVGSVGASPNGCYTKQEKYGGSCRGYKSTWTGCICGEAWYDDLGMCDRQKRGEPEGGASNGRHEKTTKTSTKYHSSASGCSEWTWQIRYVLGCGYE